MAIQMRRGNKIDLDKSNLQAGEIILGYRPEGDFVGIAKGANDLIQLATTNDLSNAKSDMVEEVVTDLPNVLGFEIVDGDLIANTGGSV